MLFAIHCDDIYSEQPIIVHTFIDTIHSTLHHGVTCKIKMVDALPIYAVLNFWQLTGGIRKVALGFLAVLQLLRLRRN